MYNIKQTEIFSKWLHKLKDIKAKVGILRRIERMRQGNFGDVKALGDDVLEMRLDISAGYRVYFTKHNDEIVFLLNGGDKSTQSKDIEKAKEIARELQK